MRYIYQKVHFARDCIELIVLSLIVVDEVIAYLHFRAETEIYAFPPFQSIQVEPKLRLALYYPFAIHGRIIPQVAIAGKGAKSFGKGCAPHLGELHAAIRMSLIVAVLEVVLIQQLHREGL